MSKSDREVIEKIRQVCADINEQVPASYLKRRILKVLPPEQEKRVKRKKLPWDVDYVGATRLPGQRYQVIAKFLTQKDCEDFIAFVIAPRDPDGVADGAYGINGPNEG